MNRWIAFSLAILIATVAGACLPSGTRGHAAATGGPGSSGAVEASSAASPSGPDLSRTIVPPTPTPAPTFLAYVVRTGDSLNTIAHRFGTTARSIAFWNRATYPSLDPASAAYKPNRLDIGWTLVLIPNDVVDEQDLPDPSTPGLTTPDPNASDPADAPAAEPSGSAAPE